MKIICTQENLKSGLLSAGRIISNSTTLPILNNVLIKTENGLLKILSTNLEIAIITHVRCKVEEEGQVTVTAKTITDLVNNLPNKNITLESKDGGMTLDAENYHTTIKTLPAEEFPLIPQLEAGETLTVNSEEMKSALDQVIFAVSKNQTQPEISGVLLSLNGQNLVIVATDRYRLAEKKLLLQKEWKNSQDVIVPYRTMLELSRLVGSADEVVLSFNDTQVSLVCGNTQIISRLIDGQYPDYKQIIPAEFSTEITVDRNNLISGLKASGVFSQNTNSINFEYDFDKQLLSISAESQELGKSKVDISCSMSGPSGLVILNYHYVLDCLLNLDVEEVIIKIINDSSPSIVMPKGKSDYTYLVMPIKS